MFGLFKKRELQEAFEESQRLQLNLWNENCSLYRRIEIFRKVSATRRNIIGRLKKEKTHLLNLVTEYEGKLRGVTSAVLQEEVNQVEIARLNEILARQKAVDLQKDAEISALHKRVDQLNSQLKESEALSRERREHIGVLDIAMANQREQIGNLDAIINEFERDIEQLSSENDLLKKDKSIKIAYQAADAELRRWCIDQAPQHTPVSGKTTIEVAQEIYSWVNGQEGEANE
jgi:chromosome segregation ATPase